MGRKSHNLNSDSLKDTLSNTSPNAADTTFDTTTTPPQLKATSNAPEPTAGNGFTAGGTAIGSTAYSQTTGTATLSGGNVVFTASGGTIGPFRYVICYNNTAGTTATRAPILWWDYGSSITLADGETFTVDHSAGLLSIA